MMCWVSIGKKAAEVSKVSVAGCLGYDVLEQPATETHKYLNCLSQE
jgi:hypothetical protein